MSVVWKNIEIFNADEIYDNGNGSISWRRIPEKLMDALERDGGRRRAVGCTGVELRFVMKSDKAVLKKKLPLILGVFLFFLAAAAGCAGKDTVYRSMDTAMGTVFSTVLYQTDNVDRTKEVRDLVVGLEEELLSRRLESSELFGINDSAGKEDGILISDTMQKLLKQISDVSQKSGGAFDITVGDVVKLWDIDSFAGAETTDYVMPEREEIAALLEHTGYEKVRIEEERLYLPAQMSLDLGAVGKGTACDTILSWLLEQQEITGAVISVGGSILTYGEKADHRPYEIGIVNPEDTSSFLGYLELKGQWCISTSGDYERYVEYEGVRYHHILDPGTGYPAQSGLRSVTVLCKNGTLADALSTACFVLGKEKALELLEEYEAFAVFADTDGEITLSPGTESYFRGS